MASDPTKRIANWDAKYDTTRIKAIIDQKRPDMLAHVQAVFPDIYQMEVSVRQTIDALGVPTIDYAYYLGFGREMWSLTKKGISGASLAEEAAVLISKWVARGLTLSVLEAIRTQVFNVGAPVGP